MKKFFTGLFCISLVVAKSQSISGINFSHLYNPSHAIDFRMAVVNINQQVVINYSIQPTASSAAGEYIIAWESRSSYGKRNGEVIRMDTLVLESGKLYDGYLTINEKEEPWIVLAIVSDKVNQTSYYAHVVNPDSPVFAAIKSANHEIVRGYLHTGQPYRFSRIPHNTPVYGFRYRKDFPSALPPHSRRIADIDPVMLPDSSFVVQSDEPFQINSEGLFLFQLDTTTAQGIAVRAHSLTFPGYSTIEDLVGPLVYVTTEDEYAELSATNGDKLKFDKIVLEITRDRERATDFMKTYYHRVELANRYFTSFKQGWKTDRGMVYIIFGMPDNVSLGNDTEIWFYGDNRTRFVFLRAGSLYDPGYFVLQRSKSYSELWYNTIDLWRKARF